MKKLLCLISLVFALTGCESYTDINDMAYLVALGIDKADTGYNFTMSFANPIAFAGKESGESNSVKIINVTSDLFNDAFLKATNKVSKKVDVSYLKLIVLSDGVNVNELSCDLKLNPNILVAAASASAENCIENIKPPLEIVPSSFYENILSNKFNEYAPKSFIKDFNNEYILFPLINEKGETVGVSCAEKGNIIFSGSANDGRIFNVLKNNVNKFLYKDNGISELIASKPIIILDKNTITVDVCFKYKVLEGKVNEAHLSKKLTNEITDFFNRYYSVNGLDVLDFKSKYKRQFLTNNSYDIFLKSYNPKNLEFKVNIKLKSA